VVITTHSPSTVALAPEESLFEMRRAPPRIEPVPSKARAVAVLTDGFVSVQEATQMVFLEGKDDLPFYERVRDLLTQHPGPLEPFPSLAFVHGRGKETVETLVPQMRERGLENFHAIIDMDSGNTPSEGLHWHCPASTDCLPLSHSRSSHSSFLVLSGAAVFQSGVPSAGVVEALDVLEDRSPGALWRFGHE
jgi:hypothetical protein